MKKLLPYALLLVACSKHTSDVAPISAALDGHWLCQKDSLTVFRDGSLGGASMIGYLHYTRITPTAWVDSLYNHQTTVYACKRQGDTLVISPGLINYHNVPFVQSSRPAKHAILKLTAHELHLRTAKDTIAPDGIKYHNVFDRYYTR